MRDITTDITNPIGIKGVEILFSLMDNPLIITLIVIMPLFIIFYIGYRYEKVKEKRRLIAKELGLADSTEINLWIIGSKNSRIEMLLRKHDFKNKIRNNR